MSAPAAMSSRRIVRRRALGCDEREVDGAGKEEPCELLCGRTPRQAMQWLGTKWGRDMIGASLWVAAWARQADKVLARAGLVAVDDVRFADEARAIRDRGGLVVRIARAAAGSASGSGHKSEALAFYPDHVIVNYGDLSALNLAVVQVPEF